MGAGNVSKTDAINSGNGLVTIAYEGTTPPCYARGSRIATDRGEVAVEDLAIGDLVVTASGETTPIRWIGWREIDCASHPEPEKVWPIRIAAGAIAPGAPVRDLFVSPGHCLFFDDVLIPANLLANGSTIVQTPVAKVSYWHVELDRHDILLAEGLAAESYLDAGNRTSFANGGAIVALHPDFAPEGPGVDAIWAERAVAPHCKGGPRLTVLHKWLALRAEHLGVKTTLDPGVRVLADGEVLIPVSVVDGCFRFEAPEGARRLRLCSRAGVPAALPDRDSRDVRRLGVAISRLEVDGREIGLDAFDSFEGWHAVEDEEPDRFRWSGGDAELPPGRAVTFQIRHTLPAYPLPWRRPPIPGTVINRPRKYQ